MARSRSRNKVSFKDEMWSDDELEARLGRDYQIVCDTATYHFVWDRYRDPDMYVSEVELRDADEQYWSTTW